jgi:uncharacterized protein (DUF2062 family)
MACWRGPALNFNPEHVIVVIPLYNHAEAVRKVAQGVLAQHERLMVVDDGSSDGGGGRLTGLNITLLRHEHNRGKGAALKTAAREARRLGMTHMVTIDADGQHNPSDIPRFFEMLEKEPLAIVVGQRNFAKAKVPGASRFGRQFSNFWLRLQTGQGIGDSQSGFRAYPLVVFDSLHLVCNSFAFEVEVLVKAAWAGIPLKQVDVAVHYPKPSERISHFNLFTDNLKLTILNTHLTLRSVTPWPHRKIVHDKTSQAAISVLRPLQSLRLLLTEHATPRGLAAAGAAGMFLGTLPLIACHTMAILFFCSFFRLNKAAAVGASQLCMPPLVPAICIETGYFMRHGQFLTEINLETLGYQAIDRLLDWLLGSLAVAPVLAIIVGMLIYGLAGAMARIHHVKG